MMPTREHSRNTPTGDGAILAARHSFMPNLLGYCGPDANQTILDAIINDRSSEELRKVLRGFEGAYPYLQFLADQSGTNDPFNFKVTEAYWLGNELLERVAPDDFYTHLMRRLRKKFPPEHLKQFFKLQPYASFPHHSLHVFNAFSTMGTVPDSFASGKGGDEEVGRLMDKCRISWAKVLESQSGQDILVEYQPIVKKEQGLLLDKPARTKLVRQMNGTDLLPGLQRGDWVSAHWGFACTILTGEQVANLKRYTLSAMELANKVPIPD